MISRMYDLFDKITAKFGCLAPLLARLSMGFLFIQTGWGKLHNLDRVIGFFAELGIPYPQYQAPFVAGLEFVGGLMLIAGFLSRLIAIPLSVTMIVAIITAKASEIESVGDLFSLSEFSFLVLLVIVVLLGSGPLSLDCFLSRHSRAGGNLTVTGGSPPARG